MPINSGLIKKGKKNASKLLETIRTYYYIKTLSIKRLYLKLVLNFPLFALWTTLYASFHEDFLCCKLSIKYLLIAFVPLHTCR